MKHVTYPKSEGLDSTVGVTGLSSQVILHEVTLGYRSGAVVDGISGRFPPASMTAVVGPNGAGKTTLLKGVLGLIPLRKGAVECAHPRRAMAYLAQASEVDQGFPVTVEDFVAVGLWTRIGGLGAVTPPLAQRVRDAIAAVGLHGSEEAWIGELSGGQFQRVRFARLLAQDAPIVLLDEPFSGIDAPTVADLLRLIAGWHVQGKTIIAVLHDLDLVRAHFPQTLALAGRVLAWGDTAQALRALADHGHGSYAPEPRNPETVA
ncbi:metal ABC transporter ATP-binding protein [Variovorax sp. GB1P17]|uniref:metal ABC transporter ATP-binding protein n=1 Tax=Variovorax sp. GB1P17 TaxID=3443740 RepID=UPI003F497388